MEQINIELPPETIPSAVEQIAATPQEAQGLTKLSAQGGLLQISKSEAVLELEETGIRGGGMVLLRVIVQGMEDDLRREKLVSSAAKEGLDSWKEKFFLEKVKTSVLEARITFLTRLKVLQNVFLSVGGIFSGLGVKLLLDIKLGLGLMFFLIGALFLFGGWLWPTGVRNEEQNK